MLGSTITPNSLAMIDVVAEAQTPMISMAASARIVEPVDAKTQVGLQDAAERHHDVARDRRRTWPPTASRRSASSASPTPTAKAGSRSSARPPALKGLKIVANERYARTDTSVTGQVLKLVAAKPDAVLIAGSGTPAALPQKTLKERGYAGKIYQTHGVANNDFLRVGGKDVEGTLPAVGPGAGGRAAARLAIRCKKSRAGLRQRSTRRRTARARSRPSARHAWDAGLLMQRRGAGGAEEGASRARRSSAPRCAMRSRRCKDVPGAHGIFNMSPTDHLGLDQRARVMVKIENGAWTATSPDA